MATLNNHEAMLVQISGQVDTLANTKMHSKAIHTQLTDMEYDLATSVDELGDDIWNLFTKMDSLKNMPKFIRKHHRHK